MATPDEKRRSRMAQAIYTAIAAKNRQLPREPDPKVLASLARWIELSGSNGGAIVFDPDKDNVPDAVIQAGQAFVLAPLADMEAAEIAALELLVRRSAPALGLLPFDEFLGDARASKQVVQRLADSGRTIKDPHIDFYLKEAAEAVIVGAFRDIVIGIAERSGIKLDADTAASIVAEHQLHGITPTSSELVSETLRLAGAAREERQYRDAVVAVLGATTDRPTVDAVIAFLKARGIQPGQRGFEQYVFSARLEARPADGRGPLDVLAVADTSSASIAFGDIRLPPLDNVADMALYPDNIRHLGLAYFVMQFEELKVFRVADWLAREFLLGRLQVQFGQGGQRLYQYLKRRERRFSEVDRLSFYRRVFGVGPGQLPPDVQPNDAFPRLWMNLLVATTEYITSQRVGDLFLASPGAGASRMGNRERILRAARDLQTNLSQAGFGGGPWFAREMAAALQDTFDALSDRQLLAALGAPDAWTLVQRVASMNLGGMLDVYQKKTMAEDGRGIFEWLADHHRDVYYVGDTELERLVGLVERWLSVNIQGEQPPVQAPAPAPMLQRAPSAVAAPDFGPSAINGGQPRFSA